MAVAKFLTISSLEENEIPKYVQLEIPLAQLFDTAEETL